MMMSLKPNFKIKKLTIKQKNKLADTLLEWGNMIFVGSFLYQAISQGKVSLPGVIGLITWVAVLVFSIELL